VLQLYTVELQAPSDEDDWDELRWFLLHQNVIVLLDVEDGSWMVQLDTPCKELGESGCRIHGSHPGICRCHSPEECERNSSHHYISFRTPEQLAEYRNRTESTRIAATQVTGC
jgi:uncharacterized protein